MRKRKGGGETEEKDEATVRPRYKVIPVIRSILGSTLVTVLLVKVPAYVVFFQNTAYEVIFFGHNRRPYIRDAL